MKYMNSWPEPYLLLSRRGHFLFKIKDIIQRFVWVVFQNGRSFHLVSINLATPPVIVLSQQFWVNISDDDNRCWFKSQRGLISSLFICNSKVNWKIKSISKSWPYWYRKNPHHIGTPLIPFLSFVLL